MNAPLHPQLFGPPEAPSQPQLSQAAERVQRFVWASRFGSVRIEVVDGVAYVNGERVEPARIDTSHPA